MDTISQEGVTRRDFLRASAALAAALGWAGSGFVSPRKAMALEAEAGGVPVIWLQGAGCSGCSVSFLNSVHYATVDELLTQTLDLEFHPTVMPAAGNLAISSLEKAYRRGGYVLIVEGAIPTGAGGIYCELWPGLTLEKAVSRYTSRAAFILAVGSCASFGGLTAGAPNPTAARGLSDSYQGNRVIKIPGCPCHPDWLVGTVSSIIQNGKAPPLDGYGRPTDYFQTKVHDRCPLREEEEADALGQGGCLKELGCKGPRTRADCPTRRWNSGAKGAMGVNWCIGAGAPCYGCTEPTFPDGMSPFYELEGDD
jgi:hydrogenase small subunit